ncbi:M15 family metallopeptidase [uncultured Treponema sp.]|uniref:M15 family metallopeptidase n=1 Tax=uncultured Treponema sp. TaxID=162155 RepID=UPI002591FA62|nr:M15 family metallopeptidase [uncultured Treponema sp.]
MTRKILFAAFAIAGIFCLAGCGKKAYAQSSKPVVKIPSAEEEKFSRVFQKMSSRAKEAICVTEENKTEFIKDLYAILEEEKTFRADDKSLFFLIDKKHTASSSYAPKDLVSLKKNSLFDLNKDGMEIRKEAYSALNEMAQAALNDGIRLLVSSAYRSYSYQENLFNYWVSVDGLEEAERESARPGTSQHQLGTAVDFGSISDDFDKTQMGQWIYKNAADYGWSLSFPKGYEDVTGYRWECWHFRYIGKNACRFQQKWFGGIQQFMLEFIDCWKNTN